MRGGAGIWTTNHTKGTKRAEGRERRVRVNKLALLRRPFPLQRLVTVTASLEER